MSRLRPEPTSGWTAFVAWGFCGTLWTVSAISFAGLFVVPLALVLSWLLFRYAMDRRDAVGLIAGVAAFLIFVGLLHIADTPCPQSGVLIIPAGAEGSVSCGGLDSFPWLASGSLLLIIAFVLYWLVRHRHRPESSTHIH